MNEAERFLSKIDKTDEGCQEWQGGLFVKGYGQFELSPPKKPVLAHRYAFELYWGVTVPPGLGVLHECDNRKCVSPAHLFIGDSRRNTDDMMSKGRQSKGSNLPQSKLNEWSACGVMARLLMTDEPLQRTVGEEFGVGRKCVNDLWIGKNWAHLFTPNSAD